MRKRIVIGAIAGLAAGLAGCVSSHSKAGAAEWHKAEYLLAIGKTADGAPQHPVPRRSYERPGLCGGVVTGAQLARAEKITRVLEERATKHSTALLELCYLAQRTVVVTGAYTRAVTNALRWLPDPFVRGQVIEIGATQLILVTALTNTLGRHLDFIRKADAPVYEDNVVSIDVR